MVEEIQNEPIKQQHFFLFCAKARPAFVSTTRKTVIVKRIDACRWRLHMGPAFLVCVDVWTSRSSLVVGKWTAQATLFVASASSEQLKTEMKGPGSASDQLVLSSTEHKVQGSRLLAAQAVRGKRKVVRAGWNLMLIASRDLGYSSINAASLEKSSVSQQ